MSSATLPLIILLPLLGAITPLLLAGVGRKYAAWSAAVLMLAGLALLMPLAGAVLHGQTFVATIPWLPAYGLNLAFRLDGLGLLFALLILGIGLLVVLYAFYYLPDSDNLGRFYALLLVFMSAMLGIVLAENLLMMLVFWELTSLSSFLLIAYNRHLRGARVAARMALAVTGGGGLALLAGILLLGHVAGGFELSVILAKGAMVREHPLYATILALVLLGVFTKSAQFPFHFWLPNAMAAPTPVSAYLHSATMVKAGVFLLARFFPVLSGTDLWFIVVSGIGAITLVYAAYMALLKHDLKGLLAYSTVSHLGLITLLFGLDTALSAVAGLFHIINHAIFKASLFMAAGIVDHECGTRDMRRINGMFRYMPITGVLGIVAAASMAGVPFLNGFLSKEMFFAETTNHPAFAQVSWILALFATAAGVLSAAYSSRFIHDVFFNGDPVDLPRQPHEPPRWMRAPVEVLVVLCLVIGVLPGWSAGSWLAAAAGAVLQAPLPDYELKVWHGFTLPLAMSAAALGGGVLLYAFRSPLFRLHEALPKVDTRIAFERAYKVAAYFALTIVARLDNSSLQRYMSLLIGFTLIYGGWALATGGAPELVETRLPVDAAGIVALAALAIGAVGATVMHRRRLLAIVLVGVVGLIVALTFVRFSAPDLALTQLAVEVVTIVLMLLALHYLPQATPPESSRLRMARDGFLALAAGAAMAAVTYWLLTGSFQTISNFYLDQSIPGGGGANVVNVILVDFRGFDTLGEITVLAMAALGVHALLDRLRLSSSKCDGEGRPWSRDRHPIFLEMLMRPLLPLAMVVSVFILLRGHNLPGGGFVAGLVTGVALILQYLSSGIQFGAARLPRNHTRLMAIGLALAAGTGAASALFGYPFLTSAHGHVRIPLLGDIELASAMLFDLGVYIVVVTTVLMALSEIGHLSERKQT